MCSGFARRCVPVVLKVFCVNRAKLTQSSRTDAYYYYVYYYEYKTSDPQAGQKGGGIHNVLVVTIHLAKKRTVLSPLFQAVFLRVVIFLLGESERKQDCWVCFASRIITLIVSLHPQKSPLPLM